MLITALDVMTAWGWWIKHLLLGGTQAYLAAISTCKLTQTSLYMNLT